MYRLEWATCNMERVVVQLLLPVSWCPLSAGGGCRFIRWVNSGATVPGGANMQAASSSIPQPGDGPTNTKISTFTRHSPQKPPPKAKRRVALAGHPGTRRCAAAAAVNKPVSRELHTRGMEARSVICKSQNLA